ncbi:DUF4145 domain-containing protein [Paenibacillus sp. GP183]|uniref:DUF4145 domain-containing protein n=1 Tax=Paenibacillus sp. GP183 TaxID=1882751 RepID=UPI00089D4457|nr:DUF4145 domain-containing protein [Paenibacillus sp. GP183]SED07559.1 protein of unknown function [Paenibacillus sp. GP183]
MTELSDNLDLSRCPHCSVASPNLKSLQYFDTNNHNGTNRRVWRVYFCSRCGGLVTAWAIHGQSYVRDVYPSSEKVNEWIPSPAHDYLQQALESIHAPAGAVMLAASSVDAMLKLKGYKEGSLYTRIGQASTNHLITNDMAKWAHEVRLDANDQRHADDQVQLPNTENAKKVVDFALALGEILFVLPSKVQRGLQQAQA